MKFTYLFTVFLFGITLSSAGQNQWSSSRIQHEINKLQVNGTVLYIAAHPDDENTRMISWLANEKKFRTAYLSLTRGDGGQNLIGSELGVKLGIIRTHELVEARKIDGGEQYFTRAFDFGYSKTAEETFTKWNRDSILSDMVFVIRKIQPDIIITRFPPDYHQTHGHHTASAMLAMEAYEAAADPSRFPEQFAYGVHIWAVKQIFYNASTWWNKDLEDIAAHNDSFFSVDVGTYNPLLGISYTEMAGKSRSMHKSQGFGSSQAAGEQVEYLKLLRARVPVKSNDPFDFDNTLVQDKSFLTTFNRTIYSADNKLFKSYMTNLVILKKWYQNQALTPLLRYREKQLDEIVRQSCGLKITLSAENLEFAEGDTISSEFSILRRLAGDVKFISIKAANGISQIQGASAIVSELPFNKAYVQKLSLQLDPEYFSQMPWIRNGKSESMFNNSWRDGGIYPGTDDDLQVEVTLEIFSGIFRYSIPLYYIHVDRVKGELYDPVLIKPAMELNPQAENILFINSLHTQLPLRIQVNQTYAGPFILQLEGPFSAKKPFKRDFTFEDDTLIELNLELECLETGIPGKISFRGTVPIRQRILINYDHIGILPHCEVPEVALNAVNLRKKDRKIAYLQGAGDEVAEYLGLAGYQVFEISQDQLKDAELQKFDVLILGIRSYNTLDITDLQQKSLLQFAKNGGNVIVQYITSRGIKRTNFAPFPLEIDHGRVTEEEAQMNIIDSTESILRLPNKLNAGDFNHWVQERGLYFASSYDSHFRPVFKSHDTGEEDLDGALLIADYGAGSFIYTGISFFRQLPAGVPGAYRLIGNMIDYEPAGNKN